MRTCCLNDPLANRASKQDPTLKANVACVTWRGVASRRSHFPCRSWQQALSGLQKVMAKSHRFWHEYPLSRCHSGGHWSKGSGSDELLMKNRVDEIRHTYIPSHHIADLSTHTKGGHFIYSFIHSFTHSFPHSTIIHWVTDIVGSTMPGTRYISQGFSNPPHLLFPVISDLFTLLVGSRLKLTTFPVYSENSQDSWKKTVMKARRDLQLFESSDVSFLICKI